MKSKAVALILFSATLIAARASVVAWDAGGDGVSWGDPLNWDGDVVPATTDEVVLGPGIAVTVSGNYAVLSLQSQRPISIGSGSLSVTAGASEIKGALTMALGTALAVSGAGTTFLATNIVNADGASFYASSGGQMRLPGLRSFSKPDGCYGVNWQAIGIGSVLDMSGVTNLYGGDCFYFNLRAISGGLVVASNLVTISNGYVVADADGAGSVVDLGKLANYPSADRVLALEARNGGQIIVPLLVDAGRTRITLRNGGLMDTAQLRRVIGVTVDNMVLSLPAVTNVDQASLYVENGGRLSLPLITSAIKSDGCYGVDWQATGLGSVLDMSAVTNLYGGDCFSFNLRAISGGLVVVSNLVTISQGFVVASADGAGSVVDLGKLANYPSTDRVLALEARNSGQVIVPLLVDAGRTRVTLRNGSLMDTAQLRRVIGVTVDNMALSLPAVTNVDQASLYVENGGRLSLPLITSVVKPDGCYDVDWQATGIGSVLDMSTVTNLYGGDCFSFNLQANSGGQLLLGNLGTINGYDIVVLADGVGSVVDLSKLTNFFASTAVNSSLTALNSGVVLFDAEAFVMVNVGVNIPPGNPVLPPISIFAPNIVVRGTAWHSYLLEQRSLLSADAPWQFFSRVPLTNYFHKAFGKPPVNTAFRVSEFIADPAVLELSRMSNGLAQLLLYGTTTNTYQIESTTNLIAPILWTPGDTATMTNAFRFFTPASAIEPHRFFRSKKL